MLELTEVQIGLIGIVGAGVLWLFKLWRATSGNDVEPVTATWVLFGISLVLAFIFAAPVFPMFPVLAGDPGVISTAIGSWVLAVVTIGTTILGFATLVYAALAKIVLDQVVKKTLLKALKAKK